MTAASFSAYSQSISGFVLNEPIPSANIFVQELQNGTSTDLEGKYLLNIAPENYRFIFSAIGYESKQLNLKIGDNRRNRNIILKSSDKELDEITLKAKKRDPAFEIIQKVIENKKAYLLQPNSAKNKVYVKATLKENGREVYKIKVISRKLRNYT